MKLPPCGGCQKRAGFEGSVLSRVYDAIHMDKINPDELKIGEAYRINLSANCFENSIPGMRFEGLYLVGIPHQMGEYILNLVNGRIKFQRKFIVS